MSALFWSGRFMFRAAGDREAEVLDIFASMPELHVLSVTRNHIVRETKEYR